jgi:hypothetical protein
MADCNDPIEDLREQPSDGLQDRFKQQSETTTSIVVDQRRHTPE